MPMRYPMYLQWGCSMMEAYIQVLLEQIRCKKVQPYIREEIRGHLEEQIADNMAAGMSRADAEKAAVEDMGSPVEVGVALDRIHRPKVNWGLIGLMAVIALAGIIVHELMWRQMGLLAKGSREFLKHTLIGFALMLAVYRIDYSVIARFSKIIAAVMILACVIASMKGNVVGGVTQLELLGKRISLFFPLLLYVPVYGAVIYKYHGQGYDGLVKSFLWMLVPVICAFYLPQLMLSVILLISMMVVLTVALAKDWFIVPKKKVIAVLWGCGVGVPLAGLSSLVGFGLLKTHQMARIKAFLCNTDNQGANYMTWKLREVLENCQFVGSGTGNWMASESGIAYIPECNTGYIFSFILYNYGILAGIMLGAILVAVIAIIFRISFKQKNQLAMCMGCGCGMILALNIGINMAENIGLLPVTETFLPFFSRGGSGILVCYVLLGIVLSIYRYKDIYPKHVNYLFLSKC